MWMYLKTRLTETFPMPHPQFFFRSAPSAFAVGMLRKTFERKNTRDAAGILTAGLLPHLQLVKMREAVHQVGDRGLPTLLGSQHYFGANTRWEPTLLWGQHCFGANTTLGPTLLWGQHYFGAHTLGPTQLWATATLGPTQLRSQHCFGANTASEPTLLWGQHSFGAYTTLGPTQLRSQHYFGANAAS